MSRPGSAVPWKPPTVRLKRELGVVDRVVHVVLVADVRRQNVKTLLRESTPAPFSVVGSVLDLSTDLGELVG